MVSWKKRDAASGIPLKTNSRFSRTASQSPAQFLASFVGLTNMTREGGRSRIRATNLKNSFGVQKLAKRKSAAFLLR
jgi:hypothetical protein